MKNSKFEIVYSLLIIVTIPALLVANTIFLATNAKDDFITEIRRKADSINQSVAIVTNEYIKAGNEDQLQSFVTNLAKESPTLQDVYVAKVTDEGYTVVASSQNNTELREYQKDHLDFAKSTQQSIARKDQAVDKEGNVTNIWQVATPVKDETGAVVAVAASAVSTADADELIQNTYVKSYIFLAVSIAVILALLVHHFKIAGYSRLLAKQKEINQTMSDFLSVATHELKAPTSIIKGYIANIMDGTFGDVNSAIKEQLQVALNQTERLNNLVKDLLNVSRVEQGRVSYTVESVDIGATIKTIVDTYQQQASAKGLELMYNTVNAIPVKSDPGRVQEIFTNLIDNAIKYTPSGSVVVSHRLEKQYVVTSIRDTGMGISAEDRKRLFQRFYRVANEQTKEISGTGLGLWIIKQYIEHMGGKIEVDSLVGSGTEFLVYLPADK